ncbi:YrhA family protein [Listeria cornellensis]|uniref:SMI1 / KNR4 family protein n=1 Tax=Listeria cornellensis FSL F6-0969 TaxID=1265820 RepID=W7BLI0_9LIST|nr:YrhA family protein [Listeria cornellensis]EUJ25780.1 SMI1 / KNR4 family protein [Listeria cornellensis FSL F6-0969]
MLLDILKQIAEEQKSFDEKPELPATKAEILELKKQITNDQSRDIWFSDYATFLKIRNGLDYDGLVIYNANVNDNNNGFIAANEIWHENEWEDDYVFFGDSNISWYCYSKMKNTFLELDKPSGDVTNRFSSLNELLESAFKNVL